MVRASDGAARPRVSLVMSSSLGNSLPPHSFLYACHFVIQSWLHNHSFNSCQLIMQRSTSTTHAQRHKLKKKKPRCSLSRTLAPAAHAHTRWCEAACLVCLPNTKSASSDPQVQAFVQFGVVRHHEEGNYTVMKVKKLTLHSVLERSALYFLCLAHEAA